MDLDEIKQILDMMRQHDLAEFELERDNVKIRLRKNSAGGWNGAPPMPAVSYVAAPVTAAIPSGDGAAPAPPVLAPAARLACGTPTFSPMYSIGASSRSPSPMTMVPSIGTVSMTARIASTAT
jgi:acetyl-CoA carboxylase biotin carboxyl carrier protein